MNDRFILTVFGMQGAGKTSLVKELVRLSPKPVFILDTMDEYDNGLVFYSMLALKHHLVNNNMNVQGVHILKADNDEDAEKFFRLFTLVKEQATIVIEEADKFMGSSHNQINDDIKDVINYGRHWNQSLMFIARRPARVNKEVTSQSNCIISFRQTESNDIKSLSKSYDEAKKLPQLEQWEWGTKRVKGKHFLTFGKEPEPLKEALQ